MSELNQETANQAAAPTELDLLKERADRLGINYKSNVTAATLKAKIDAALSDATEEGADTSSAPAQLTEGQKRIAAKRDALKMVRIRLTCMNPNKKEWPGELFTVSNSVVGTVKRYVPFDNEEGWHVENIIYQQLRERQCQIFAKGKSKNGVPTVTPKLIKEFAIDVLDPLSKEELAELARKQAMAGAVD